MTLDKFRFRNAHVYHQNAQHCPKQHPQQQQAAIRQAQAQASQRPYDDRLANHELEAHRRAIEDYCKEMSINTFETADKFKPDVALIRQQPQLTPEYRAPLLDFLFKISKRTRVCPSTFHRSVRLLDRYCSKRIVLLEQAQLVATTCLWLVAKTDGGCSHCAPSLGGRFVGPTMRARIPRLSELCQLCGPSCSYDEGMFVQMERHILDTLNWEVTEPSIYEWCFNIEENNTMTQYLSQRQKDAILLKQFLIDCSLYDHDLISVHPAEIASSINDLFTILQARLTPSLLLQKHHQSKWQRPTSVSTKLILPSTNLETTEKLITSITRASEALISSYSEAGSSPELIKNYMQESYHYLMSLQKSKKRAHSDSSFNSQESSSSASTSGSTSQINTSYSDSGEEDCSSNSDTDSLFEHIVNRSMSLNGGSRTPSPLPSPDKIMFDALKRQNTITHNLTTTTTSPYLTNRVKNHI